MGIGARDVGPVTRGTCKTEETRPRCSVGPIKADFSAFLKARNRTRTDDPFLTMEVLYQLSYPGEMALLSHLTAIRLSHPVSRWHEQRPS
jgi:hypothetical protein